MRQGFCLEDNYVHDYIEQTYLLSSSRDLTSDVVKNAPSLRGCFVMSLLCSYPTCTVQTHFITYSNKLPNINKIKGIYFSRQRWVHCFQLICADVRYLRICPIMYGVIILLILLFYAKHLLILNVFLGGMNYVYCKMATVWFIQQYLQESRSLKTDVPIACQSKYMSFAALYSLQSTRKLCYCCLRSTVNAQQNPCLRIFNKESTKDEEGR